MSNWLRVWSLLTVTATVVLLVLGALVTSFRVGMADPIWPTEPWRLALIDWSEPNPGFILEHAHRLGGFTIGGMMAILALGLWWTEPSRTLRLAGLAALAGLLGAFGSLHGVLIRQTRDLPAGSQLVVPPMVAAILVSALALVLLVVALEALTRRAGWGLRLLGVALLICVMIQGLFGGLRVYLNAQLGPQFAVVHGTFAQLVFGLTVAITCVCLGREASWSLVGWLAIVAVFAQIAFGVTLRQLSSPMGARLHLLTAFITTIFVITNSRLTWKSSRLWATVALSLLTIQIGLGVESWLGRYANGLVAATTQPITWNDAILRTVHAVVGYLLFAATIVMAFNVHVPSLQRRQSRELSLEAVA